MEPAAVLVVAFQVEVGLGPGLVIAAVPRRALVRAAQHVAEGRTRVEPDVEDVVALGVVRSRMFAIGAQPVGRVQPAPGLDAAFTHQHGRALHQRQRVGVQIARHLVQEEGQRHAPVALAADAPVGSARDHVAQAGPAVLGVETGLVDGGKRLLPQRAGSLVDSEHADAFVHAHKPLRGGAVNHRRLVAPAVRVAVLQAGGVEQAAGVGQGLHDDRAGLPDVQAAEQGQGGFIAAVALHRVQDLVGLHAVRHARVEVVHAIGR